MSETDEMTAREQVEKRIRFCDEYASDYGDCTEGHISQGVGTLAWAALYIGDAIMAVADELRAGREDGDAETIGKLRGRIERLIHKEQPPCTPEQWEAAKVCTSNLRWCLRNDRPPGGVDRLAIHAFDEACRKAEEQ